MRTPPSRYNHPPKALPPNTTRVGVRISAHEFCRGTHVRSITMIYKSDQNLHLFWPDFYKNQQAPVHVYLERLYVFIRTWTKLDKPCWVADASHVAMRVEGLDRKRELRDKLFWIVNPRRVCLITKWRKKKKNKKQNQTLNASLSDDIGSHWNEGGFVCAWIIFVCSSLLKHMNHKKSVSREEGRNCDLH